MRRFLKTTVLCMVMFGWLMLAVLVPIWLTFGVGWPIMGIIVFLFMISSFVAALVSMDWNWVYT